MHGRINMPAVARVGDAGAVHCSSYTIATGSSDVFIDGRAVARNGDSSTVHQKPSGNKCVPHVSQIIASSSTVFVNGIPVAVVGDRLSDCTQIIEGSESVFIG
jgi:uncharacterized Zn-binding protein involved in type VI secretion